MYPNNWSFLGSNTESIQLTMIICQHIVSMKKIWQHIVIVSKKNWVEYLKLGFNFKYYE